MARKWANCAECGILNRRSAATCRMCGAAMRPVAEEPPRVRRKLLRRTDFMAAAEANRRNTNRLVFVLLAIGGVLGYLLGWLFEVGTTDSVLRFGDVWFVSRWGVIGALGLLGFGVVWTLIAFRAGDRIVLSIVGAREVSRDEEPQLHNVVEEMAIAAGLPKPRVCVIETPAMNAFATGLRTDRAAIGVTRGLLDRLTRDELQGVVGHEMGHIVNLDTRYATAVGVLVGLIALVSDLAVRTLFYGGGSRRRSGSGRGGGGGVWIVMLLLLIFAALAPLFAKLVQMAVSRQREFLADATSVRLTRNPQSLIAALEKLADSAEPFKGANRATQHMFIVNPFRNFSEKASRLLATGVVNRLIR
ncbi:MAG: M48 family metallopeptidase [Ectothiorhodospiraceae bacterium]|jgi:heat shock protein HtpX